MSAELPVSTGIRATTKLAIIRLITKGSSCGSSNPTNSQSEKLIGSLSMVVIGDNAYNNFCAYFILAFEVSPPPAIPPEMVSTLQVIHRDAS
ncbi:hypothetical protein LIER_36325 [Lithospermum erythrorhizon]|uniref:Uncharacterized protein n=1 Tax=Lithospermum erythrorhizon TaxID=34254 RepID=A0AAV3P630_LITER